VSTIRTEKTDTEITIPLLAPLVAALKAGPTGDLAFISGADGEPLNKESFGNAFRDACRAAGIKKSAHGLRKLAATRAAENLATTSELNALFGWTGTKMAHHYTQGADRKRLAKQAASKLLPNNRSTNNPAPSEFVREKRRKRK